MPEIPTPPTDIPVYLQALLNIVAFLLAAASAWYAYFVKGRDKASSSGTDKLPELINSFDAKVWREMGSNLKRLADAAEHIANVMQHDSDEAEIDRRVRERLREERSKR